MGFPTGGFFNSFFERRGKEVKVVVCAPLKGGRVQKRRGEEEWALFERGEVAGTF